MDIDGDTTDQYSAGQINIPEIIEKEGNEDAVENGKRHLSIQDIRNKPVKRKNTGENDSFNKKRYFGRNNFESPPSYLDENNTLNSNFNRRILDGDEKFSIPETVDSEKLMRSSNTLEGENPTCDVKMKLPDNTSSISDMHNEVTVFHSTNRTNNETITKEQDLAEQRTFLGDILGDMILNNNDIQFIFPSIATIQCIENNEPFIIPKEHLITIDEANKLIDSEVDYLNGIFNPTSMHLENYDEISTDDAETVNFKSSDNEEQRVCSEEVVPYGKTLNGENKTSNAYLEIAGEMSTDDTGTMVFIPSDGEEQNVFPEEVVPDENTLNGENTTYKTYLEIASEMSTDNTRTMDFGPFDNEKQNVSREEVFPFGITTNDATLLINDVDKTSSINLQIVEGTSADDTEKGNFRTSNTSNSRDQNVSHEEALTLIGVNDMGLMLNDIDTTLNMNLQIAKETCTDDTETQNFRTSNIGEQNVCYENVLPFIAVDEPVLMLNNEYISSTTNFQVSEKAVTHYTETQNLRTSNSVEQNVRHQDVFPFITVDNATLMLNDADITSSMNLNIAKETCTGDIEIHNFRTSNSGERNACNEDALSFIDVHETRLMLNDKDIISSANLKISEETDTYDSETKNFRTSNNGEHSTGYEETHPFDTIMENTMLMLNIDTDSQRQQSTLSNQSSINQKTTFLINATNKCDQISNGSEAENAFMESINRIDVNNETGSETLCAQVDEPMILGKESVNSQPASDCFKNSESSKEYAVADSSEEGHDDNERNNLIENEDYEILNTEVPRPSEFNTVSESSDNVMMTNLVISEGDNIPTAINQRSVDQSFDTICNVDGFDSRQTGIENSRFDIQDNISTEAALPKETISKVKCSISCIPDDPSESCSNNLPTKPQESRSFYNLRSRTTNHNKPSEVSEKLAISKLIREYLTNVKEEEAFSVQDIFNFVMKGNLYLSHIVITSIRSHLNDYTKKGIVIFDKNGKYKIKCDTVDMIFEVGPNVEDKSNKVKKRLIKNHLIKPKNVIVEDNQKVTSSAMEVSQSLGAD